MTGRSRVVGPDGVAWTVRRRWFAWRRALGLREVWYSSTANSATSDSDSGSDSKPDTERGNPVARAALTVVGLALWLIITGGKAVLIAIAVVLVVIASTVDLALQILVLPVAVAARLAGIARWPVQVERDNLHVRTEHARTYGAAAALRDELVAQIRAGSPPLNLKQQQHPS